MYEFRMSETVGVAGILGEVLWVVFPCCSEGVDPRLGVVGLGGPNDLFVIGYSGCMCW